MCFTSCLERAKHTAQIINEDLQTNAANIQYDWRLNERHYGALQGECRHKMNETYGISNVMKWRHNYQAVPPQITDDDPRWQEQLDRLPEVPLEHHSRSESMAQASARTLPLFKDHIKPALKTGKNILIIAHTNAIRCIVGDIEGYNDHQSAAFRISTATPRHYQFDEDLRVSSVRDLTNDPKAKFRQLTTRKWINWIGKLKS